MLSLSAPIQACRPAQGMADLPVPLSKVASFFWTSKARHLLPLVSWHRWYDDYAVALHPAMGNMQMAVCFEGESGPWFSHTLNCWWKCQWDTTGDDGDKPSESSHKTEPDTQMNSLKTYFKMLTFIVFCSAFLSNHFHIQMEEGFTLLLVTS